MSVCGYSVGRTYLLKQLISVSFPRQFILKLGPLKITETNKNHESKRLKNLGRGTQATISQLDAMQGQTVSTFLMRVKCLEGKILIHVFLKRLMIWIMGVKGIISMENIFGPMERFKWINLILSFAVLYWT